MKRILSSLIALYISLSVSTAQAVEEFPAEAFFRNVEFSEVQLSPDGNLIAALAYSRYAVGVRNLVVIDVNTNGASLVTDVGRDMDTADISSFFWGNERRLIMKIDRYTEDPRDPRQYLGTFSITYLGSGTVTVHRPQDLAKPDPETGAPDPNAVGDALLDLTRVPAHADQVLITPTGRGINAPHLFRVNINTGEIERVAENPGNIRRWIVDNQAQWRAAIRNTGAGHELVARNHSDEEFRQLLEFEPGDVHIYGFDKGDDAIWLASRKGRNTFALYRLELSNPVLDKPVFEDARYDVYLPGSRAVGLVQDHDGAAIYLQYMADRPHLVFLTDSENWRKRQEVLDDAMPNTVNTMVDWNIEETRFLVSAWSDREPGQFHIYEPTDGNLKYMTSRTPWIESASMVSMQPVNIEARDGLALEGYLLQPANGSEKLPLIVLPHNKPFAGRVEWGFNPQAQFFANQGYAVLTINYRGSVGYGRAYEESGYGQWGLKMQDDVADAVRWVIDQGVADPQSICIYGTGYGGYSALMGVIRDPELYKCAASYNGFSDLWLLSRQVAAGERFPVPLPPAAELKRLIGDPDADAARFAQGSPTSNVDRIEADLFILSDRAGLSAPRQHFDELQEALKAAKIKHNKYLMRESGLEVWGEANRVNLYLRLERFFDKQL